MMRRDGKVALITCGGRGIGKAHAELLAARGRQVLVNDAGVESTVPDAPAPEDWAVIGDTMLTDKVTPIPSLIEAFARQILAVEPGLTEQVETMRKSGVNTNTPRKRANEVT